MEMLNRQKGLTFIETIVTSMIVVMLVMGSMQLLSRIYMSIQSTKLKTISHNIASESLEYMKHYSFRSIPVTPDDLLPQPLTKLEDTTNPWGNPADSDNIETVGTNTMKVYKWVQNAEEDDDGNIVSRTQQDLPVSDLKQLKVVVEYTDRIPGTTKTVIKYTELTTIVSNSDSNLGGATIRGRLMRKDKSNGRVDPPGLTARVTVYVENHPEYTAVVSTNDGDADNRGYYRIYNVMPGTYRLYAVGQGYDLDWYDGNPLVVPPTAGEITGINFICEDIRPATISGTVYMPDGTPANPDDFETMGREVRADDGVSSTTTVNTFGQYTIMNITPDAGTVSVTAIFTKKITGETFFASYPSRVAVGNNSTATNINLTLQPVTGSGVLRVYAKDATDRTTPLGSVAVTAQNVGNTNTVYSGTTDGTGMCTLTPLSGSYILQGTLANYRLEQALTVAVSGFTSPQTIYLYPVGAISGTVIDEVTNLPVGGMNIQVKKFSKIWGETLSDTITGYYIINNIPVGALNTVIIGLGNSWEAAAPPEPYISNVTVNIGTTTPNQDFTIKRSSKPISGSLGFNSNDLLEGVLIVAQPVSNTVTPHAYSKNSAVNYLKKQNTMSRKLRSYQGTIGKRSGMYKVMVPLGFNYDVYAYYSAITCTGCTLQNYYKVINNVTPDTTGQDFDSGWTNY